MDTNGDKEFKEVLVVLLLYRHSSGETEQNHKKPRSDWRVVRTSFDPYCTRIEEAVPKTFINHDYNSAP
jgi:hypothetical protein